MGMMLEYVKNNITLRVGANFAPIFLIPIYYLLVGLDIYTTYLATPNLKYEANLIIRFFCMTWAQIIIFAFIGTTFLSTFFIVSRSFIVSFYQKSTFNNSIWQDVFREKGGFLGIFFIGCFYSHFFTSIFVIFNNYLNYLYLYRIDNFLKEFAFSYVKLESAFYPFYYLYTRLITVTIGFLFTFYKIKKIKRSALSVL